MRDAANGSSRRHPSPDDELDALADLFLGDQTVPVPGRESETDLPPTGERTPSVGVPLEGLVLGHLPVFAAAWPSQYARHRSAVMGKPVLVVRHCGETVVAEIIGGPAEAPPAPETDLEAALRTALTACGLCILRVDEDRELDLTRVPSLDSLVLLTGADDAAVVACYRKLKAIASDASESQTEPPRIGLAVMGAPRDRAEITHERIARAAREYLEAALREPVILERIATSHARTLYHGPATMSLELIANLARQTVVAPRQTTQQETTPRETTPVRPPMGVDPSRIASLGPSTPTPDTMPSPTTIDDPLAALAGGLRPLESRCPVAGRVALATDAAGRLHLVVARLSGHAELSSRDPLRDVLRARAWARLNGELLRKAERELSPELASPRLHLITDDAREARALSGVPIGVHLAAEAAPVALGLMTLSI